MPRLRSHRPLQEPTRRIRIDPPSPLKFNGDEPRQPCSQCQQPSTPVYRYLERNFCQQCWHLTPWPRWHQRGEVRLERCVHCGVQTGYHVQPRYQGFVRFPSDDNAPCGAPECFRAARAAHHRQQREDERERERSCGYCGRRFLVPFPEGVDARRRYCDDACRQAAYRQRKRGST